VGKTHSLSSGGIKKHGLNAAHPGRLVVQYAGVISAFSASGSASGIGLQATGTPTLLAAMTLMLPVSLFFV